MKQDQLRKKAEESQQLLEQMDSVLRLRWVRGYLRIYGIVSEWRHAGWRDRWRMIKRFFRRLLGVRTSVHELQTFCFVENLDTWRTKLHQNESDIRQLLQQMTPDGKCAFSESTSVFWIRSDHLLQYTKAVSDYLSESFQEECNAAIVQNSLQIAPPMLPAVRAVLSGNAEQNILRNDFFCRLTQANTELNQQNVLSWLKEQLPSISAWISVIVPVYNVLPYLDRCIESIIRQTVHRIEIILVDDGSTDGSGTRCDAWASKDNRIRVLHQKNSGLSAARNAGIEAASGDYLSFIDSDDWIEPDMLENLLLAAKVCDAQIAECNFENVYPLYTEAETLQSKSWLIADRHRALWEEVHWGRFKSIACNKVYHRELFIEGLRYPVGKYHEDEFLTHQLFYKAERLVSIDDALYHYDRTRQDSITGQAFAVHGMDKIEALRMHSRFLKEHGERELYPVMLNLYVQKAVEFIEQCGKETQRQTQTDTVRTWLLEDRKECEANGVLCDI